MFSSSIRKLCLRQCNRKRVGVYFSTSHHIVDSPAINSKHGSGKFGVCKMLALRRCKITEPRPIFHKRQYSTNNDSLDSVQSVHKTDQSVKESQESLAVDQPEEFVQSVYKTDDIVEESQESLPVGPPEEFVQSLNEEDQRRLKILWMELEVFRQTGCPVPRKMNSLQWREAMEKVSRSQRLKFYRFLCIREARKEKQKLKTSDYSQQLEKVRAKRELEKVADPSQFEREYGLCRNTIFLRIDESRMNFVYNYWQCHAVQFGQSIVIDLSYNDEMTRIEAYNCAMQIRCLYGVNKRNREPFHLHLCNASPDNQLLQLISKVIPNLRSPMCIVSVSEESYLNVFPKEKLVYLTPHCQNDLVDYDHDSVYIIGGMVDKASQKQISLAKAKREGIAMARLPLDRYLDWGQGKKSLTIDQMMKIMLDIKNTGCWNTALKHIPKRKLKNDETSDPLPQPQFKYGSLFDDDN